MNSSLEETSDSSGERGLSPVELLRIIRCVIRRLCGRQKPTLSRILSGLTREEIRTNLPTSRIEVDHKAISVGGCCSTPGKDPPDLDLESGFTRFLFRYWDR
ncbi:hypothetical protein FXO38_20087 [Capsicum annuum]|nr:hypothetical protein FXO38_20087 [Capsicum annuum]